ncbi:hypothetical protein GCM10011316_16840 [Roseibium aquae]|uniref:Tetratricopeptide repeat protein n=1 Tax=Roseibium aquae TaxID=1323746 RepID=A0A916X0Y3_9HYPH|nr:tetratricopeptide repeat protein [Roseibium aquae]GGB45428.1 hypothetical protein GCM10011316_16840 [Roseibium aquae]
MKPDARPVFEKALSLEQAGQCEAALGAYLDALDLDPENMDIAYRAATALLRNGHLDEAVSQLRRIVFVDPDHIGARANLGNCQLLLGDLGNAETNFEHVLQVAPNNHNALYGLASVRLKQGRAEAAQAPATQLAALIPDSVPALTLYAETRAHDPQASAAIAAFRKALAIDRSYAPALTGLADLLIRRRRGPEARGLAEEATRLDPANPVAWKILGEAFQLNGAFEDAYRAFDTAHRKAPGDASHLVRLSVVSRKLGELGRALAHAFAAVVMDPGNKAALNALGAALTGLGESTLGRTVLQCAANWARLDADTLARIRGVMDRDAKLPLTPKMPETGTTNEPEKAG